MSPPENTKQISLSRIKSGPLNYVVPIIQYFSSNPHPPHKVRLCSVGISHYVEKVRWGFTLSGIDYIEDAHTPGLASIATTTIDAETSATPIIKTENGQVVKDSTAILQKYCPELYPTPEVLEIEEELDKTLGPSARVFAYHHLLKPEHKNLMSDLATRETSIIETILFKMMVNRNLIQPGMKKFMCISSETALESQSEIESIFETYSKRLETSPYLAGDAFTAADVTFCALSSPLLSPSQFDDLSADPATFPTELIEMREKLRATPAGRHVVRCYNEYRFGRIEKGKVEKGGRKMVQILSGKRDRWGVIGLVIAAPLVGFAAMLN
ncbi:hypothetical protein TrST_g8295 [Triparma strigata]|uniref:Glutathione S-transferase n=1 Tax=Triparma strigata TaxID=1606541 RepID=A0A9W7DWD3_9STRA|nr:hypothetical protein TrST_g8295 [Triparma strigata]